MQTGFGKGKGFEADNGSPTRMEQGQYQQAMPPVPPSTPSSSSRQQAQVGAGLSTPGGGVIGGGCGGCSGNGLAPGLLGQIPSDPNSGGGFMSQWQGQMPSFPQFQNQSCGCQTFNGSMQTVPLYQAGKGSGCSVNPQVDFQGGCVGGCTPQVYQMNQLMNLSQGLSSVQLLTLVQGLQERIRTQGRDMPEVFGQRPVEGFGGKGSGSGVPPLDFGLDVGTEGKSVDVFSKSEKWLGTPPVPNVSSWSSRDAEVIGWSQYVSSLSAWAAQASMDFSDEIQQASRWPSSISWDTLQPQRRARALRLHAILKAAFNEHPRTSNLISAFGEGVKLIDNDGSGLNPSQIGNGYELLRQLTGEYSLRNRGEALALRTVFLNKNFALSSAETSPSSIVSDLTRRLDLESARYSKLLGTLPSHVDIVGLQLTDADLLLVLMKALPEVVKSYVILHSIGDSYASYRQAACKWESQQRMFVEHSSAQGKVGKVHEVSSSPVSHGAYEYGSQTEWFSIADDTRMIDAVDQKCSKCGSRKHVTSECQTDVSKLACFRCGEKGHISAHCPKKSSPSSGKGGKFNGSDSKGSKGKTSKGFKGVKGKFDRGKGKGKKGKSFGKKGKLNELGSESWSPEDYWWWSDDESWWWPEGYDVNQVSDWNDQSWYGHDWHVDGWQDDTTSGVASQAEPSPEPQKSDQPVGSLVISALVFEDLSDECCLGLELLDEPCNLDGFVATCFDRCVLNLADVRDSRDESLVVDRVDGFGTYRHGIDATCFDITAELCFPEAFWDDCDLLENLQFCPSVSGFDIVAGLTVGKQLGCCMDHGWSGPWLDLRLKSAYWHEDDLTLHDGLIAPSAMRVKMFVSDVDIFLNHDSELSHVAECQRYAPLFSPLLSELGLADDCTWWLLDSGASVTVLSKSSFVVYAAEWSGDDTGLDRFSAANGSSVSMHGKANVSVFMCLWDRAKDVDVWKKAKLSTLVGETRHNILSTTTLCKSGWSFSQGVDGAWLVHDASGFHAHEVTIFAGCPWVRLHPHAGLDTKHDEWTLSGVEIHDTGVVNPLSKAAQSELEQHRAQGHTPHNPHCLECGRGRSTYMHRRSKDNLIETELQADFCFLSQNGELSELETAGAVKILVLGELVSNCVAYIVVTENEASVRREIVAWLNHFGLESEKVSIVLHTDAETAVRTLVTGCSPKFVSHVRKARPQQHQSVGLAERSVRRLKESLTILRADLNGNGLDLKFGVGGLSDALTYLSLVHNHFGRLVDQGKRTTLHLSLLLVEG